MEGQYVTSNTPGAAFGITASGTYSPRLELLQNEMASGQYTTMEQAAMLGREIASVYQGKTGDMNASPYSIFNINASTKPVSTDTVVNGPTTSASWIDQVKQWFSDHAMAFVLVLIGVVFLFGAFLTYRK